MNASNLVGANKEEAALVEKILVDVVSKIRARINEVHGLEPNEEQNVREKTERPAMMRAALMSLNNDSSGAKETLGRIRDKWFIDGYHAGCAVLVSQYLENLECPDIVQPGVSIFVEIDYSSSFSLPNFRK